MKQKPAFKKAAAAALALTLALPAAEQAGAAGQSTASAPPAANSLQPVRTIATSLGLKVSWNPADKSVTLTRGDQELVLKPGESGALFNGKQVEFARSGPAEFQQGQTWASEAWIQELFGLADSSAGEDVKNDDDAAFAGHFLDLLSAGSGKEAYTLMSSALQKAVTPEQLGKLWSNYEQLYGQTGEVKFKSETINDVHHSVTYSVQAAAAPLTITIRLNTEGQVDDLYLTTETPDTYRQAAYDNPNRYSEQEVVIGKGEYALPGKLTLPAGSDDKGPFPVVVLVHGSGPQDEDSSLYGAKPFRDLAVGLAAQGIATLRYDKVTYEHTFKVASNPTFTLKDETVDDALKAVKLLGALPEIDSSRIYVAGHSQGGFAMPLIKQADTDHQIAGTILLSAPSSSFTDVVVLQQEELVKRIKALGQDTAPYEQQEAAWKQIAGLVNDREYSADHLPASFPVSPAYWWYEQRDYVPAEMAKKQNGPMLILQGENDWQVPMSEFEGWKTALSGHQEVTFKSYPKVNHLLAETNIVSTGAEYAVPSNVSKDIIEDIADWILNNK